MSSRWTMHDPVANTTYTFDRNPREMTTPHLPQSTTPMGTTIDGLTRAARSQATPIEWTFTGDLRTKEQHDALKTWAEKQNRIQVKDHFDRVWEVMPIQFDATELRPRATVPWRYSYRMRTMLYRRVS